MSSATRITRWRGRGWLHILFGGAMMFGLVQSCDHRVVELSRIFDPCGTVLANCAPGQLAAQQADAGDPCYLCPIPGTCGEEDNQFLNICR